MPLQSTQFIVSPLDDEVGWNNGQTTKEKIAKKERRNIQYVTKVGQFNWLPGAVRSFIHVGNAVPICCVFHSASCAALSIVEFVLKVSCFFSRHVVSKRWLTFICSSSQSYFDCNLKQNGVELGPEKSENMLEGDIAYENNAE